MEELQLICVSQASEDTLDQIAVLRSKGWNDTRLKKMRQGFRQDLNFEENLNDVQALSNLGGVGIAGDLRIIQNNLRNTSSIGYVHLPHLLGRY